MLEKKPPSGQRWKPGPLAKPPAAAFGGASFLGGKPKLMSPVGPIAQPHTSEPGGAFTKPRMRVKGIG